MNTLLALFTSAGGLAAGWFLAQRAASKAARLMDGRLILTETALADAHSRERARCGSPTWDAPSPDSNSAAWWAAFDSAKAAKRREVDAERHRVLLEYAEIFERMLEILYRHDPIRIAFDMGGFWEYDPEVRTILLRIPECESAAAVRRVVYEEFCYWFDCQAGDDEAYYQRIAEEIWSLWLRFQSKDQPIPSPPLNHETQRHGGWAGPDAVSPPGGGMSRSMKKRLPAESDCSQ